MYTIQTAFEVKPGSGRLCFDATDRFHHAGRYINHVVKGANLKPVKPVFVREKWRVGFVSLREIEAGEELCYDYGLRTEEVWHVVCVFYIQLSQLCIYIYMLCVLCCLALFVCLTLLASFFLPSHLSFKTCIYTCTSRYNRLWFVGIGCRCNVLVMLI